MNTWRGECPAGTGDNNRTYYRERFRYALRIGLKGELYDNFYYGLRLETSANPRSPWVTFADDTANKGTPISAPRRPKTAIHRRRPGLSWMEAGQLVRGDHRQDADAPLHDADALGRDINPEGAVEKFKLSVGDVDLFANFGQFIYQDSDPDTALPSSDTFLLAWQVGANLKLTKDISFKVAPVLYSYTELGVSTATTRPRERSGIHRRGLRGRERRQGR